MALIFKLSGAAVSGTAVEVFEVALRGAGPCRLIVKNVGASALSAGKVQVAGEVNGAPLDVDTATFGTLAASATGQVVIPRPIEVLRFEAACASGTTLDIWLTSALDDGG